MHTILALAAALSFGSPGAFTLNQARTTATRYEQAAGLGAQVQDCRWLDRHDAECAVTLTAVVTVHGSPQHYAWEDRVTRSGPCSNPGRVVKKVHGLTYQDGGTHYGNCFTGPLVASSIQSTLQDS